MLKGLRRPLTIDSPSFFAGVPYSARTVLSCGVIGHIALGLDAREFKIIFAITSTTNKQTEPHRAARAEAAAEWEGVRDERKSKARSEPEEDDH